MSPIGGRLQSKQGAKFDIVVRCEERLVVSLSVRESRALLLVDSETSRGREIVGRENDTQNFALKQSPSVLALFLLFRIFKLSALDSALIQATEASL